MSLTIVGKIFPLIRLKVVRKVLAAAIARVLGKNLGRVGQELGDEGSAFLGGGVGGKSGDRHHGASKAKLVAVCVNVPEGKVATRRPVSSSLATPLTQESHQHLSSLKCLRANTVKVKMKDLVITICGDSLLFTYVMSIPR